MENFFSDLDIWLAVFSVITFPPYSLMTKIHVDNPSDLASFQLLSLATSLYCHLWPDCSIHCHGHLLSLVFAKNCYISELFTCGMFILLSLVSLSFSHCPSPPQPLLLSMACSSLAMQLAQIRSSIPTSLSCCCQLFLGLLLPPSTQPPLACALVQLSTSEGKQKLADFPTTNSSSSSSAWSSNTVSPFIHSKKGSLIPLCDLPHHLLSQF